MREEPRDELIYRNNKELFYSFEPGKGYTHRVDYQYEANQTIIRQGWEEAEERLERVKKEVLAGKSSPIGYFMEKNLMEVPMLADYVGLPKWRVRRHLNPRHFLKLTPEKLQKYARVFDIPIADLVTPDFMNHANYQHGNDTNEQT